jgi:hypothetical protein
MSVKTEIQDGGGTSRTAGVTEARALLVSTLPTSSRGIPPGDLSNLRQLREFFTDSAGVSNQRVDGSTTPVEYTVNAGLGVTKWITGFRMIIEANGFEIATADFRDYGATGAPGLPNGIDIEAFQGGVTTSISASPIQTAGDYLNYADEFTNFVNAITSQADYLQFVFRFDQPVVLTVGSADRLIIRINDDLVTALQSTVGAEQYAIARGYQETV